MPSLSFTTCFFVMVVLHLTAIIYLISNLYHMNFTGFITSGVLFQLDLADLSGNYDTLTTSNSSLKRVQNI